MANPYGKPPLFTFALIADSHMNPGDENSSPFETNRLANARSRYVIEEVNRLEPDFVVHLGDLVHPVPGHPNFEASADDFSALYKAIEAPLHIVAGNHDCGDKPISWMPAAQVNERFLAQYADLFGPHYGSFDHKGMHFVFLNTPVMNSGLALEAEQRAWLERDLDAAAGRRTFLFLHYPPFVTRDDEETHYDNIDEPSRSWLLDQIDRHAVEAVFAGHVHNFFYGRRAATEFYILPSVCFVRQDYAEFARATPGIDEEGGRNDEPKLGYFLVEVHADGHIAHNIRSSGRQLAADEAPTPRAARVPAVHSREEAPATVGLQLRHPWAEVTTIPHNYALDEFTRKHVRNDYPLLALWEMGVKKLRVPVGDLRDVAVRQRMADLRRVGHSFTVFTYGRIDEATAEALTSATDAYDAWEVIVPEGREADEVVAAVRRVRRESDKPVYVSALHSLAESAAGGEKFKHLISSGFPLADRAHVVDFIDRIGAREIVEGVVFRIDRDGAPWTGISQAAAFAGSADLRAVVHVRFAADDMRPPREEDLATANRAAESVVAALAHPGTDVYLDTLVDHDRGYFLRHGLIDRRFNPRLASHVVRHLHAVPKMIGGTPVAGERVAFGGGHAVVLADPHDRQRLLLVLPDRDLPLGSALGSVSGFDAGGVGNCIDLRTGTIAPMEWNRSGAGVSAVPDAVLSAPALVISRQ